MFCFFDGANHRVNFIQGWHQLLQIVANNFGQAVFFKALNRKNFCCHTRINKGGRCNQRRMFSAQRVGQNAALDDKHNEIRNNFNFAPFDQVKCGNFGVSLCKREQGRDCQRKVQRFEDLNFHFDQIRFRKGII